MFVQFWIVTHILAHLKKYIYFRVGLINKRVTIKPSFPHLICIVDKKKIVGEESVLLMSNKHILIVKRHPCWVTCEAKKIPLCQVETWCEIYS